MTNISNLLLAAEGLRGHGCQSLAGCVQDAADELIRLRLSNDRGVEVFERSEAKRMECEAECKKLRGIIRGEHLWKAKQVGAGDCRCHCDVCEQVQP